MIDRIKTYPRVFTCDDGFGSYREIPYFDSLAKTVKEFLYTCTDENKIQGYCLDGIINLFDFMSLEIPVVKSLSLNLGKDAIKSYIDVLRQNRYSNETNMIIEYENLGRELLVCNASDKLIMPLLWTAHIYARTRYMNERDELFGNATIMLFELMMEYSFYNIDITRRLTPINKSEEAINMLFNDITHKHKEPKEQSPQNIKKHMESPNVLGENVEKVQNQLADAQKIMEKQAQTINKQQEKLKRLATMNEVLTKQNARFDEENPEMDIDEDTALSIKESIIFFSSIMDCNLNKEDISQMNLARLISKITRWPKESIRPQIVDINTERENNIKNHTAFSDGVHQAAVNVCALIENAMAGLNKNPLPYSCKQAVENICKIYQSPGRKIEPHEIAEAKKNLKKN